MLISANCVKALEPMKIIYSTNGGPNAYMAKLGWCIVGPIATSRSDGSVRCDWIAVKDFVSGKITPHCLVLDDKIKIEDADIREMLKQMYYFSNFCEGNHLQVNSILGKIENISRENRKVLDILETGTKKDEAHYEVPLPFRDIGV